MTEDNHVNNSLKLHGLTNEQDCNSNCPTPLDVQVTSSRLSNVSSNDSEVPHDTSDYQWFLEYGYKDPVSTSSLGTITTTTTVVTPTCINTNRRQPPSIFAVLNSSGIHGDLTYEDLARNIDANLAEIDMENFQAEDINSILALPAMYCGDFQSENHGERAASLSGSIMAKVDAFADSSSVSHHSTSGDSTDMSVCKSEPLFSPVKDNPGLPAFSVDSLDCDSYNEQELMLTCQANMNNYTIAFEGSYTKYSDDSDYHEAIGSETTDSEESWSGQFKLRNADSVNGSLVQSDFTYTTWSKLKHVNDVVQLTFQGPESSTCKSQSLPNLFRKSGNGSGSDMRISQLNVSTDSEQCVPVYDIQSSHSTHSRISSSSSSQHSLSLMRLFIQQKANSSGVPSVTHSLSSGTLQQLDLYGSDALQSFEERLQNVLTTKLLGSNGCLGGGGGDEDISKENAYFKQRNLLSANEKGAVGSGDSSAHLVHPLKTADATMNALKRRMKSTMSSCKLYGGEALHDDGNLRTVSPLTSPIEEEEDETDDVSQWAAAAATTTYYNNCMDDATCSSSSSDDVTKDDSVEDDSLVTQVRNNCIDQAKNGSRKYGESRPTKVTVINNFKAASKSNAEMEKVIMFKEGGGNNVEHVVTGYSQGTQTKRLNEPCSQDNINRISGGGSNELQETEGHGSSSKKQLNCLGGGHVVNASSSASSGYVSVKSSTDPANQKRNKRASPAFAAWSSDDGKHEVDVTITAFKACGTQIPVHVTDEAIQTSFKGDWLERILANCAKIQVTDRLIQAFDNIDSPADAKCEENDTASNTGKKSLYICYPNYSLPDLSFLRQLPEKSPDVSNMLLMPMPKSTTTTTTKSSLACCAAASASKKSFFKPNFCNSYENFKNVDFSHIQDWESLNVLLPDEVKELLAKLKAKSAAGENLQVEDSPLKEAFEEIPLDDVVDQSVKEAAAESPQDIKTFVYKYGDTKLNMPTVEFDESRKRPPPLPKRSISLPQGDNLPTKETSLDGQYMMNKPPLPKGILRRPGVAVGKKLLDGTKRYSMPEFLAMQQDGFVSGSVSSVLECPNCLRDSMPFGNARHAGGCVARSAQMTNMKTSPVCHCCSMWNNVAATEVSSRTKQSTLQCGRNVCCCCCCCSAQMLSKLDLSASSPDFLHCAKSPIALSSNVSNCEAVSDVTSSSDISRNLQSVNSYQVVSEGGATKTCGCNLVQLELKSKKMVSFSSNVHVEEQDFQQHTSPCANHHNTSDNLHGTRYETALLPSEVNSPVKEEVHDDAQEEHPPQVFCVSPSKDGNEPTVDDLAERTTLLSFRRKKALVLAVNGAVGLMTSHFNNARDHHEKFILGNCIQTPSLGHKVLHHLCPALYGILNDGLHPEVYNMFGHMDNSVWLVVEAVAQSGNCNKQMSDLVIHLNNEQNLCEKKMKFNAFVFGLLNIRSLDTWFAVLGSSHTILQKHYLPNAFLLSTQMSSSKSLFDDFLISLQKLSMLPFDLDLLLEGHFMRNDCKWQLTSQPSLQQNVTSNPSCGNPVHLSKSIPQSVSASCKQMPAKINPHRHSCGCFDSLPNKQEPFVFKIKNSESQESIISNDNNRHLRRGFSQDSAIATASSDCSNVSTGLGLLNSFADENEKPSLNARLCHNMNCYVCSACGCTITSFSVKSVEVPMRHCCCRLTEGNVLHCGIQGEKQLLTSSDHVVPKCKLPEEFLDKSSGLGLQAGSSSSDGTDTTVVNVSRGCSNATELRNSLVQKDSQNNNIVVVNDDQVPLDCDDLPGGETDVEANEDSVQFKELRLKWENMCGTATAEQQTSSGPKKVASPVIQKSKIPRLVTPSSRTSAVVARMDDSEGSGRSSSGSQSPDCDEVSKGGGVSCIRDDDAGGGGGQQNTGSPKRRQPVVVDPNKSVGKSNCKLPPSQQPNITIKSSGNLDRSPLHKKPPVAARKFPPNQGSCNLLTRTKQFMSRGVGGGGGAAIVSEAAEN